MARRRAQTSIYENDITEAQPELLAALQTRAGAAERRSTANQNFDTAKKRVEELVKSLDLGVGAVVRCGDWIIEIKQREDKPIEFVRAGGQRIAIKPVRE